VSTREHRQGGTILATFILVCEDPKLLSPRRAREILAKVLMVAGDRHSFRKCLGVVEFGPRSGTGLIPEFRDPLPCTAEFATLAQVRATLAEKHEHEKPKYRREGNASTVPKELHRPDVCVMVVGSRQFLCTNLYLYLERKGPLRERLIESLIEVSGLVEAAHAERTEDTFFEVRINEPQFYPGNFNALFESLLTQRYRLDELTLPPLPDHLLLTPEGDEE
jgi:hypothetical protein